MTQLQPTPTREIQIPLIGEIVDLDQPNQVAQALEAVRDAKRILDEARSILETALIAEATRQGTKTLHLGKLEITIVGGETVEWDHHRLALALRDAGLPENRIADVVVETVTYKVSAKEAKRIAGANPEYAAIVEACRRTVPAPFRAYIKR
jgi:hypothetical protein